MEHFLGSGEQVVFSSRQHPVVLFKTLAAWVATMAAMSLSGTFVMARTDSVWVNRLVGGVIIAATLYAVAKVLQWWATRYVITDERVMQLSGLLSVRISSVPFSKVNDTTFSRSLWGRLLGFGNLYLESAGERTGLTSLVFIPNPREAYRLLINLLAESRRTEHMTPARPRWAGNIAPGADDTGPLPRVG